VRALFLVLFLGLALGQGVELRLYRNFAEVAEPVALEEGVYVWQPGPAVWERLIGDRVWLSGARLERVVWRKDAVWLFAEGEDARLHYLTRGLSGELRYRLELEGGELEGWLWVRNELGRPVRVEELVYIAGAVPIAGGAPRERGLSPMAKVAEAVSAPGARYEGAGGGVFRYRYDRPVVIEPERTGFPLYRAEVRPLLVWSYRGMFVRAERLPLSRGYRFEAPLALGAGSLDLFKGGTFLGSLRIGDAYEGDEVDLPLGPATRARAVRRVEVLAENAEVQSYRVTTRVENRGEEAAWVEIEERFPGDRLELVLEEGERVPRGYRVRFRLPPKGEHTYRFRVTIRYAKKR